MDKSLRREMVALSEGKPAPVPDAALTDAGQAIVAKIREASEMVGNLSSLAPGEFGAYDVKSIRETLNKVGTEIDTLVKNAVRTRAWKAREAEKDAAKRAAPGVVRWDSSTNAMGYGEAATRQKIGAELDSTRPEILAAWEKLNVKSLLTKLASKHKLKGAKVTERGTRAQVVFELEHEPGGDSGWGGATEYTVKANGAAVERELELALKDFAKPLGVVVDRSSPMGLPDF